MRIFGIILAGGQGRRMGADKALLQLDGRPLLAHVIDRLEPQVESLAISANGDPARFARFGLPVLPDDTPLGPLSGILAGLNWAAAQGADALVSAPVDAPFLPGDLTPRLILAGEGLLFNGADEGPNLALARSGDGLHPACALWPCSLAPALTAFLASGAKPKVTDFAFAHAPAIADFPDDGAFANLNTPDDLLAAEILLRANR